ncbi:MAG: outer membrane protein assembly factor BamD [Geobacteraceae bacterium GWC2_48_7]|nr:MAG: outer membrane protein assembly factor BamD [Geobacteraceae bacterium GWC2_48_7]
MTIKLIGIYFLILVTLMLQACATVQLNKTPEEIYSQGETNFRKGNYEEAIAEWKKVKESYHSPELSARAEIGIADAYFMDKDYIEAAAAYEDFRKLHPVHAKAEYALFRQGMSYYRQIHGIDTDQLPVNNAVTILESYLKLYPTGEYIQEVRDSLKDCRNKQLQYEIYVGRYYLKTDKYPAAIARFEAALARFPDSAHRDELLFYLGKAYREAGDNEKARNAYEKLVKEYPASPFAAKAPKNL